MTGKSRIYTDTPEKNRLEELERERESRMRKQEERKRQRVMKQIFREHNKKLKIVSRENINLSTSSSDTDWSLVFESDDLSDEVSEKENTIELLQDDDIINENDFLWVKFPVKSNIICYIELVIEVINLNEYLIKFLHCKKPGYNFFYPVVDNISTVDRCDILLKLPAHNSAKMARTSSLLSFRINLSA
ncbi:hypothetical protein NQ314_007778 [Rhamnusium bicolor]|uniref:Uncharacterized protein n=1 Tax=Rhamnusium bicolor TaxID=1586634 RepID=A0AAV8YIP3_9CUCU|nr:hypothetical protein NQ314_007778 [Rhamnusium bicolor]